jgi:hypothetical protein
VRVELIVDNQTLHQETGNCKAAMTRKYWNVKGYIGNVAQIKIVDASDAALWGYIAFDDLRVATGCEGKMN